MSDQFDHRTFQSGRTVFRRLERRQVALELGKGYGVLPPRRMSKEFNSPPHVGTSPRPERRDSPRSGEPVSTAPRGLEDPAPRPGTRHRETWPE